MTSLGGVQVLPKRSPQRLQFARQRVGPLRDIAGAETDDQIAAAGDAVDHFCELGSIRQRDHFAMAVGAQAKDKMVAVDARYRRLAGGIDVGDDHGVGSAGRRQPAVGFGDD